MLRKPELLLQFLDRDFLEEHDITVTVILQADVALQGSRTKLRFKVELARRHWIAFGVVGHLDAGPVEQAHAALTLDQSVFHRVTAGTDVFPARQVLSIEELLPVSRLRLQGKRYAHNKQTDTEPTLAHVFLRRPSGIDFLI